MSRDLKGRITFALDNHVLDKLVSISLRLGLEKSELCRRAVAIGLKRFERVRLPGSPEPEES